VKFNAWTSQTALKHVTRTLSPPPPLIAIFSFCWIGLGYSPKTSCLQAGWPSCWSTRMKALKSALSFIIITTQLVPVATDTSEYNAPMRIEQSSLNIPEWTIRWSVNLASLQFQPAKTTSTEIWKWWFSYTKASSSHILNTVRLPGAHTMSRIKH